MRTPKFGDGGATMSPERSESDEEEVRAKMTTEQLDEAFHKMLRPVGASEGPAPVPVDAPDIPELWVKILTSLADTGPNRVKLGRNWSTWEHGRPPPSGGWPRRLASQLGGPSRNLGPGVGPYPARRALAKIHRRLPRPLGLGRRSLALLPAPTPATRQRLPARLIGASWSATV